MRQSEIVYQQLRGQIIAWDLLPEAPLGEVEIAHQLGVSRTPVREALRSLEHDGLVVITPQRGAVVSEISISGVSQLFQLRDALETYAARLAARQADLQVFQRLAGALHRVESKLEVVPVGAPIPDELHVEHRAVIDEFDDAIRDATKNVYLQAALRDVAGHVARLRRLARLNPDRTRAAANEHVEVCLAICARDESCAAQKTAEHLRNSLRNVLTALVKDVAALSSMSGDVDLTMFSESGGDS